MGVNNRNVMSTSTKPIWHSAKIGIGVFALTVLVSVLYANLLPKQYCSKARIIPYLEVEYGATNYIANGKKVLGSEIIYSNSISELKLQERWGIKTSSGAPLSYELTLARFAKLLEVRPEPGTSLWDITCYADSPEESCEIANSVAWCAVHYCSQLRKQTVKPIETNRDMIRDSMVEIVDSAEPTLRPIKPNKPKIIVSGALVGCCLGLGAFFINRRKWNKLG